MPRGKAKPVILESKTCHVCKIQDKVNKDYGFKEKFRVLYVQNKNGQEFMKKVHKKGHDIEGTPTFFCSDLSCKEEGMKGPKLLKAFLKRSESHAGNPSKSSQEKTPSWVYWIIGGLLGISGLILAFLVLFPFP